MKSDNAIKKLKEGLEIMENNDFSRAALIFKELEQEGYEKVRMLLLQAACSENQGEIAQTERFFQEAINLEEKPDEVINIKSEYGRFCIRNKFLLKAEKTGKQLIEINPEKEDGYLLLLQVYLQKDNHGKAEEMIKILDESFHRKDAVYSNMLLLMLQNKLEDALEHSLLILDSEKDTRGLLFHQTLLMHISILKKMAGEDVSPQLQYLLEKEASLVRDWYKENNLYIKDLQDTLNQILGQRKYHDFDEE